MIVPINLSNHWIIKSLKKKKKNTMIIVPNITLQGYEYRHTKNNHRAPIDE